MGQLKTNVVKRLYIFRVRDRKTQETRIRYINAESIEAARLQLGEEYEILQESGDEDGIAWGDKEG